MGHIPPRVHWTGRVGDDLLPALYSGATGFIYVSLCEGFGLPPLEAMACGSPVAASESSSLPEVIGDAAIRLDPYSTESIQRSIIVLIQDAGLRDRLQILGLSRLPDFRGIVPQSPLGRFLRRRQNRTVPD